MPAQMKRVPVQVPGLPGPYPLQTAVTGPTGADLDAMGYPKDAPVLVRGGGGGGDGLPVRVTWESGR